MAVLIWDGALMMRREFRSMQKIKSVVLKLAFAGNRLGAMMMLIPFFRIMFSSITLDNARVNGVLAIGILFVFADAFGNLSAVGRIFLLWNKSPRALLYLISGALVALCCNLALMVANNHSAPENMEWVDTQGIRTCLINGDWHNFFITGIFIIELVFDLYAALLIWVNVMDIPRTSNSQIIGLLHKQGLCFMAVTLRIVNLVLTIVPGSYWVIAIIFVEPVIAMLNARLIVRACEFYEDMQSDDKEANSEGVELESSSENYMAIILCSFDLSPELV
ncbi:hypothetical protein CONPUDRAFT_93544 [Coniophora puteana RWD-64-598 SS2]|uniref:G-protein coupled receptors family 1 profile domain-containing protein n=1 Tax=Coniophora puteana (strain RWD-64-598) TaxID=741705 RepID=A0A5M3M7M8_CONPW|nr:uncharacterized protein CONPUDRAFT_93544 [Coniophora puteana RWD-64-598 SS2]EIW75282.1 hypothetical protein CONPUDRAFT_93544 [Coniophora puteana RWD-64-598 SS2]